MSVRLTGRAAAPGVAVGPAFVIERRKPPTAPPAVGESMDPQQEKERLREALDTGQRELRHIAKSVAEAAGEEEGEIFEAHADFAADPELAKRAEEGIDQGKTAEDAVTDAFGWFRELLAAAQSEYLAARAADLDDVRGRVVAILRGESRAVEAPTERSVIVAAELTPSETATLPRPLIAALLTEAGSPTSHAAILARALGIPAVVGVSGLLEAVDGGTELAVDGGSGEIVVAPEDAERKEFEERAKGAEERRKRLGALRGEPGRTADGTPVPLAANLAGPDDIELARAAGAEGSGLVRTEFLYLGRRNPPDVEEQAAFYQQLLQAFAGHRVVIRTLDVGADKPLPFVEQAPEPNPALGLRGIRLGLTQPDLLRLQLRAILRAHGASRDQGGRAAVNFPLVSRSEELSEAREILDEVAREEGIDTEGLEVGVMVEVPSAALGARRLARACDFLSLGTNDLLQYLFAADRLVPEVAGLPDILEPEVLRLVSNVAEAAHAEGKWMGVCGEAAADPVSAAALVGAGADRLSMTPAAIPEIKDVLRRVTHDALREAATAAMDAPDAAEARRRIEAALRA
jgi:phosphoenolpyruvate-protein phosphotransferase